MGQQQLLIIILGVLVVGIAISGGLRILDSYNQANDRDQLIIQMNSIVSDARTYAAKPAYLGGGAGSFTGFSASRALTTSDRYRIYPGVNPNILSLTGFGSITGSDGTTPVQVVLIFDLAANSVTSTEIN